MTIVDPDSGKPIKQAKELGMPKFTHHGGCPNRKAILESNHRIREGLESGPVNFGDSDGFGRVMLRIPELDYAVLRAFMPDLASPDSGLRSAAWKKLANSPLGEAYSVQEKRRKGGIYVP